jgi:hypothetical protein
VSAFDAFGNERLAQGDLDRLAGRARRGLEWRQSIASLRGEGRAQGVLAGCDANGILVDLSIPTSACGNGGRALSEAVLDALTAARQDVAEQVATSAADAFGEESPEARTVAASWSTGLARRPLVTTADDGRPPRAAPGTRPDDRW